MNLGLALSGGGAKGAAHIGVLKAFEEEKIKINYIGGTSSGSIVATLYAAGYKADDIYYIFKKYCKKIKYVELKNIFKLFFGITLTGTIIIDGLNSGKSIKKLINKICGEKNINNITDIKMPLVIPSVDMNTGDVICFTSSKIRAFKNSSVFIAYTISPDLSRTAVLASSKLPSEYFGFLTFIINSSFCFNPTVLL